MSPIARALTRVLLEHHGEVCVGHPFRPPIIDRCVITYGDLCRRAGYPGIERGVGRYLQEVAAWCAERGWPPLNSLAVNQDTRIPGDNYDVAPGCSLLGWPGEVEHCITFGGYPAATP
jgi:hypothetical protein